MTNNIINICMSCDDNYAVYLATSIQSILFNSKKNEIINFYILDGGISEKNKRFIYNIINKYNSNIQFCNIDTNKYDKWFNKLKEINEEKYFINYSPAVFYRISIPSILKEIDKILYIDVDTIITSSLYELYNINIDDYYIAAVKDYGGELVDKIKKNLNLHEYFNSGILLINNKKFIKNKLENEMINFFYKNFSKIIVVDQDILNYICNGKVKYLDYKYNFMPYIEEKPDIKDIVIIHYGANRVKPLKNWISKDWDTYIYEFWKYFFMTDFFQEDPNKYLDFLINQKINMALDKKDYDTNLYKLENKIINIIDKLVWFIPIKSIRNKIRNDILRPDQTRPDQTRPDQTTNM